MKRATQRIVADGVEVQLGRNTETDQLIVHINTEGTSGLDEENGTPVMEVTLNDATLYDYEATPIEVQRSLMRDAHRRDMAITLAMRVTDVEVDEKADVTSRDGGYYVAARVWVDAADVEHATGYDVALASDFVADADGRDARFTRTDDGEAETLTTIDRPPATMQFEPHELDLLASICSELLASGFVASQAHEWVIQRVLDKQLRNKLGRA